MLYTADVALWLQQNLPPPILTQPQPLLIIGGLGNYLGSQADRQIVVSLAGGPGNVLEEYDAQWVSAVGFIVRGDQAHPRDAEAIAYALDRALCTGPDALMGTRRVMRAAPLQAAAHLPDVLREPSPVLTVTYNLTHSPAS